MYFEKFPQIYHPVTINGVKQYTVLKDITFNVRMVKEFLSNITLFDSYDIVDDETPEIISEKLYGTPLYHWIIMLVNERYDYAADFPLSYNRLVEYVKSKYGEDNINTIHHYENEDGFVVNSDYPLAIPVTNMEHEETVNETKRTIKVINSAIVETVANDFVRLFQ